MRCPATTWCCWPADGDNDEPSCGRLDSGPHEAEGEAPVRESGGDFPDTVEFGFASAFEILAGVTWNGRLRLWATSTT